MFTILLTISAGGIAMFSVAKTMMGDVFMKALPAVVDPVFCTNYVLMLSVGNLLGRLGWAVFSDKFGRRLTFSIFGLGSLPLYASLPYLVEWVVST
jgi:MFS family permease